MIFGCRNSTLRIETRWGQAPRLRMKSLSGRCDRESDQQTLNGAAGTRQCEYFRNCIPGNVSPDNTESYGGVERCWRKCKRNAKREQHNHVRLDLNLHPSRYEFDHHGITLVLFSAHLLRHRQEASAVLGTPDTGVPALSVHGGSDRRPTPRMCRRRRMPGRNGRKHPTALPRHAKQYGLESLRARFRSAELWRSHRTCARGGGVPNGYYVD